MIKQIAVGVLKYLLAAFGGVGAIVAALTLVRWLRSADIVFVEMLAVGSVALALTGWAAVPAALRKGSLRETNAHLDCGPYSVPPIELGRDRMMVAMNASALGTAVSERIPIANAPLRNDPDADVLVATSTSLSKKRRVVSQQTSREAFTGTQGRVVRRID